MSTPREEASVRLVVTGRVQGVGFRDAVLRRALRIGGLLGHVRNLPDGSVEVCAAGEPGKIEDLKAFVRKGPLLARVDGVEEGPYDPPERPGPFAISFR